MEKEPLMDKLPYPEIVVAKLSDETSKKYPVALVIAFQLAVKVVLVTAVAAFATGATGKVRTVVVPEFAENPEALLALTL